MGSIRRGGNNPDSFTLELGYFGNISNRSDSYDVGTVQEMTVEERMIES
jgi:hypothetical protein